MLKKKPPLPLIFGVYNFHRQLFGPDFVLAQLQCFDFILDLSHQEPSKTYEPLESREPMCARVRTARPVCLLSRKSSLG
jgi:hypothetical protein